MTPTSTTDHGSATHAQAMIVSSPLQLGDFEFYPDRSEMVHPRSGVRFRFEKRQGDEQRVRITKPADVPQSTANALMGDAVRALEHFQGRRH